MTVGDIFFIFLKRICRMKINTNLLVAIISVVLTSLGVARVFTSNEGRTLEGEIVAASENSFVIEGKDRRRITVPIAKVIQADQDFVKEWKKANPPLKFAIEAKKEAGSKEKVDASTKTENYHWKITVKNQSAEPITDLTLFTLQIVEKKNYYGKNKQGVPATKATDSFTIPRIEPFGSITLTTSDSLLTSRNLLIKTETKTQTYTYAEKWEENLVALNAELYWGKRLATSYNIGTYAQYGTEKPETWQADIEKKMAESATPSVVAPAK